MVRGKVEGALAEEFLAPLIPLLTLPIVYLDAAKPFCQRHPSARSSCGISRG
jgi:hypothetical protein